MKSKLGILFIASIIVIISISLAYTDGTRSLTTASAARSSVATLPTTNYRLLSWNDLGMHCYNHDFADLAVLPPYNNLWAQVVLRGDPPQLVTQGIQVTYEFPDNTYSVGKSNFWTYAQQIFGLSTPLPDNIGLTGKGLSGTMDLVSDHFVAEGIPLTEFSDISPTLSAPYQLALITVKDITTQAILAQAQVVAPVSTEMHCDFCHSDDGDATIEGGITPTGKVETNILTLHDKEEMEDYPAGHTGALMNRRPILCAECHSSNALGAPGVTGIPSLSNAMHSKHSELEDITPDSNGCYNCHPGPVTQCLRDVMSEDFNMTCISCHGDIGQVATNPDPWLNEPRCDTCHGTNAQQNQALYRHSTGHHGIYCEACHDSTHAIAPSREPNDGLKFIALQGHTGTLSECIVCHATDPTGEFQHSNIIPLTRFFIPMIHK
ncbi:MAG: hypothetical protein A2030_08645 [Chloroflexi bacterium RBG_19FT_COMBO_50_10]|nr:MAG: hypothetical protein A2030_08645 [Chloroflexi bacterium RBG_19FT_COMBO_50_10]